MNLHLLPVFKEIKIIDITRGKVKTFLLEKLNDAYATSTVAHLRNCLRGVLNLALDDELIQTNLAQRLGKGFLQAKDHKEDINPLTSGDGGYLKKH